MAAIKVGVSESEYAVLGSEMGNVQDDFIDRMEIIKMKIEEVNCKGGGFYTDDITPNVERLLEALDEIKASILQVHSLENETINSFVRTIDNIDTCC